MIAVDTNVLVYARRAETELHTSAADGWPRGRTLGAARLLRHRVPSRRDLSESLQSTIHGDRSPGLSWTSCSPRQLAKSSARRRNSWTASNGAVRESDARGNLVFDAQIAALCRQYGITSILTNDHDFERFPRLHALTSGEQREFVLHADESVRARQAKTVAGESRDRAPTAGAGSCRIARSVPMAGNPVVRCGRFPRRVRGRLGVQHCPIRSPTCGPDPPEANVGHRPSGSWDEMFVSGRACRAFVCGAGAQVGGCQPSGKTCRRRALQQRRAALPRTR